MKAFNELKDLSTKDLIDQRMDKYSKMGEYKVKSLKKIRLVYKQRRIFFITKSRDL
jgi:hypothetical protein